MEALLTNTRQDLELCAVEIEQIREKIQVAVHGRNTASTGEERADFRGDLDDLRKKELIMMEKEKVGMIFT